MTQNEHVYAICRQPEVVVDVIFGEIVKILEGYTSLNFEAASLSRFRENQNQPFASCVDDGRPA